MCWLAQLMDRDRCKLCRVLSTRRIIRSANLSAEPIQGDHQCTKEPSFLCDPSICILLQSRLLSVVNLPQTLISNYRSYTRLSSLIRYVHTSFLFVKHFIAPGPLIPLLHSLLLVLPDIFAPGTRFIRTRTRSKSFLTTFTSHSQARCPCTSQRTETENRSKDKGIRIP